MRDIPDRALAIILVVVHDGCLRGMETLLGEAVKRDEEFGDVPRVRIPRADDNSIKWRTK